MVIDLNQKHHSEVFKLLKIKKSPALREVKQGMVT
jgi:hypothetical protein